MVSIPLPQQFPRNLEEASFFSAFTTAALPLLQYDPNYDETAALMALRTLEMISNHTDDSAVTSVIQAYQQDPRPVIQQRSQNIVQLKKKTPYQTGAWKYHSTAKSISVYKVSSLEGVHYLGALPVYDQRLHLSELKCADLSPVGKMVDLKFLSLDQCKRVRDLSPLAALTQLEELRLISMPLLKTFSSLPVLPMLRTLEIRKPGKGGNVDYSALAQHASVSSYWLDDHSCTRLVLPPQLQTLLLHECSGLHDPLPITSQPQLRQLALGNCALLDDPSWLAEIPTLRWLKLYNLSGSIPALPVHTGLEQFFLSINNNITDLSPLTALRNVKELDIFVTSHLTDISPLAALSQLTTLHLWCNGVNDNSALLTNLSALAGLPALRSVRLNGLNGVFPAFPLLANLETLDLAYCRDFTDLALLTGLDNLKALKITGRHSVQDLSPLTTLPRLATLYLEGDGVHDLRPLNQISTLQQVTLRFNGWRKLRGAAELQERGIVDARSS